MAFLSRLVGIFLHFLSKMCLFQSCDLNFYPPGIAFPVCGWYFLFKIQILYLLEHEMYMCGR